MTPVGRDREQADLVAALVAAQGGRGCAVLLLGEAGMGKSALVDWLVERAGDLRVGRGGCSAAGMPRFGSGDGRSRSSDWPMGEDLPAPNGRDLVGTAVIDMVAEGPETSLGSRGSAWGRSRAACPHSRGCGGSTPVSAFRWC
ncbi:AAA family ATPase [Nocardioides sp.]|uniref:AAA family ATPase n=1 Tax=Nocardioides sp. TaxID=35761 RepID=UPI0039C9BAAB